MSRHGKHTWIYATTIAAIEKRLPGRKLKVAMKEQRGGGGAGVLTMKKPNNHIHCVEVGELLDVQGPDMTC